jgi:uncharacterized protein YecE (DUF72 family)
LPAQKTFGNWRKQAPEGFIYAVKASRYITHIKRLRDPELALEKFISRVRLLGEALGPILYQLPPRWRPDRDRLKEFIEAARGSRSYLRVQGSPLVMSAGLHSPARLPIALRQQVHPEGTGGVGQVYRSPLAGRA